MANPDDFTGRNSSNAITSSEICWVPERFAQQSLLGLRQRAVARIMPVAAVEAWLWQQRLCFTRSAVPPRAGRVPPPIVPSTYVSES